MKKQHLFKYRLFIAFERFCLIVLSCQVGGNRTTNKGEAGGGVGVAQCSLNLYQ